MTTNHPVDKTLRKGTISKEIIIENNVWLGANVTVTPGVVIGENSIIGAGSVVTKNIPKNVIAAGIPAKVIKEI
ncbi:maltose O-acetyltransferase [Spiroplasma syrphidicola EA-1]|uniref:Acetyltransferase n=2 Tax=Spiroplasma syrphidicola TaxID=216945 RepID=R4U6H4_9MOLU|nr:maltose O-acetyltransferase [Spiroplasma syrphidicola EA-1]